MSTSMNGKVQCFLMAEKIKQMKARQRYYEIRAFIEEEKRYNPYHDPHNGQFTSGGGGGGGGSMLYVPKGGKGKGQLMQRLDFMDETQAGKFFQAVYQNELDKNSRKQRRISTALKMLDYEVNHTSAGNRHIEYARDRKKQWDHNTLDVDHKYQMRKTEAKQKETGQQSFF